MNQDRMKRHFDDQCQQGSRVSYKKSPSKKRSTLPHIKEYLYYYQAAKINTETSLGKISDSIVSKI